MMKYTQETVFTRVCYSSLLQRVCTPGNTSILWNKRNAAGGGKLCTKVPIMAGNTH